MSLQGWQRLRRVQDREYGEPFLVHFKQIAAGAVEGDAAARFTAETDSGRQLKVADCPCIHMCVKLLTMRLAARESLPGLPMRSIGDTADVSACRSSSLVHDFRKAIPRRSHSSCSWALLQSSGTSKSSSSSSLSSVSDK